VAISNNAVSVLTSATIICSGVRAQAYVQNLGANPVTIGGPTVAVGAGVTLPAGMTSPIPVSLPGSSDNEADTLYGIASGGASSVVFFLSSQGG
jgi:hypothetical protein